MLETGNPHGTLRHGRLVFVGVVGALLLAPGVALAHEKWFTDPAAYPIRWDLLLSGPVALALLSAGAALAGLLLLRHLVGDPQWPNPPWLRPVQSSAQAVIGIQTAISLIYMAVQGWLFSPTLRLPAGPLGPALAALVVGISLTFITGWFTRLGGALLVGLVALAFALYPPAYALEQMLFVGIGVYFALRGRGLFAPTARVMQWPARVGRPYAALALPALRIGTGLSILVLAFTEKLLNPGLALAFLQTHPTFNFMRLAGVAWFTDERFIYAAGIVEATIGVLLIAGVLPRVVILLMWVPFNIAIPLLPPQELLGHLPILAVMYVVFLHGADPQPAESAALLPLPTTAIGAEG